ncbi:NAD(P)/FAD-dependent oxidoreductase [Magnetospira sp. QH-2]|uniref:NAD(P)/FAD-dependent oxidoreductase n=1 Tax=Magnetospira sp. (strain QH-2) TaxID=1288970 RepID=UPI0003E80BA0|nr:NAD(P)/FAD-dependent oxidoreductase [Magnetospira sp. QH-2]CCQ74955.1 Ferredoxin--NADP reductase [Magnetospira sp. QH-2]
MTEINFSTDVIVIGAGPVGLFAIHQCGMLKMKCHVIDALDHTGGQCNALYPEKPIYDIPGYPKILGGELIQNLMAQALPFEPVFHPGQQVTALDPLEQGGWSVTTDKGLTGTAKAVIVAAGGGAFGPNRPPLDGIQGYEGHSVFYAVQRRDAFVDKRVVIAGGGDSAVDWAISLAEVAKSVAVVHRRDRFRCAPESAAQLKALAAQGKVEMVTPYQLAALEGADGQLSGVTVKTLKGEEKRLPADVLLPFFGLSMDPGPVATWGLDMSGQYVAVNRESMETCRPGVYAVGDIATYCGKLKLILCGFAEAATAAHSAFAHVHPGEALHLEFSTSKGVPAAA